MWPFKKKAPVMETAGIFEGFTDWHSHILPGVDDGIRTLEDSLAILNKYEELGVKRVWLTPHIMEDCPNTTAGLRERYEYLKSEYNGNIELRLAAENMLDALFEERINAKDILPIGENGEYLLVETSYVNPPMHMEEMIEQVQSIGLVPILAHPERYRYMDKDDYALWKDRGVLFQSNMMSLLGKYGETARGKAEWLLEQGMVDLTGSDLHRYQVLMEHLLPGRAKNASAMERLLNVAHQTEIN